MFAQYTSVFYNAGCIKCIFCTICPVIYSVPTVHTVQKFATNPHVIFVSQQGFPLSSVCFICHCCLPLKGTVTQNTSPPIFFPVLKRFRRFSLAVEETVEKLCFKNQRSLNLKLILIGFGQAPHDYWSKSTLSLSKQFQDYSKYFTHFKAKILRQWQALET